MATKTVNDFTELTDLDALDYILVWSTAAAAHRKVLKSNLLSAEEDLGLGTTSPSRDLHLKRSSSSAYALIETDGDTAGVEIDYNTGDGLLRFLEAGTGKFVLGVDNSDTDAFKMGHTSSGTPSDLTTPAIKIQSGGDVTFGAQVGIGAAPGDNPLRVYINDAAVDEDTGVVIEQDGAGDAALHWLLSATRRWVMGIDNSDNDNLKIVTTTGTPNLGTSPVVTFGTDGNVAFSGTVGITGAATVGSTLGVTGAATVGGTLGVTGVTTVAGVAGSYGTWTSLTLSNSWIASMGNITPGYRKVADVVQLRGVADGLGKTNNILATLPAGHRPTASITFANPVGVGTVIINSSGQISCSDTYASLDGIWFSTL